MLLGGFSAWGMGCSKLFFIPPKRGIHGARHGEGVGCFIFYWAPVIPPGVGLWRVGPFFLFGGKKNFGTKN